jgi:hypothetical protein
MVKISYFVKIIVIDCLFMSNNFIVDFSNFELIMHFIELVSLRKY